jgi:hypothetical protein
MKPESHPGKQVDSVKAIAYTWNLINAFELDKGCENEITKNIPPLLDSNCYGIHFNISVFQAPGV